MHAIRKAARREAWYNHDAETPTYNLLGRIYARPQRQRINDDANRPSDFTLMHAPTTSFLPDQVEHGFGDLGLIRRAHSLPVTDLKDNLAPNSASHMQSTNAAKPPTGVVHTSTPIHRSQHALDVGPEDTDLEDTKKKGKYADITFMSQFRALFYAWINVLLIFVPAGFAVNYTHRSPTTIFVVNFFAILPISAQLSYSIDELSIYIGDILGGLLTITFSNAVQLISSIFLLKSRQIQVLRASLVGAILQNLLLMTGLAMLAGGLRREQNTFNAAAAQTMGMFLFLAVLSLTVPTVSQLLGNSTGSGIRAQSRGTAVIIIFSYVLWLIFQLKTHRKMFDQPAKEASEDPIWQHWRNKKRTEEVSRAMAAMAASGAAPVGGAVNENKLAQFQEEEEEEVPMLTRLFALCSVILSTAILAFNTEFATNSIQGILEDHKISTTFMGIVILPLLSLDPNVTACGIKNKMDLTLTLTLDRSMQTALLVIPTIILIAWGMRIDKMTMDFDGFATAIAFASIIILTYVIQEGRSNWLTGALLVKVFIILGLASFYIT